MMSRALRRQCAGADRDSRPGQEAQEEPQGQNRPERRVLQRQQEEEGARQAEPVLRQTSRQYRQKRTTAAGIDPLCSCLLLSVVALPLSSAVFPLCYPEASMPHELPKAYDPAAIEEHWAEYWVREKPLSRPYASTTAATQRNFTMLLPPPNVTGRLHMGHMLNQTEMDILDPLAPHARRPHALGARHGPRRHRHPDDGGAAARRRRRPRARNWAAKRSSSASGAGRSSTAAPSSTR